MDFIVKVVIVFTYTVIWGMFVHYLTRPTTRPTNSLSNHITYVVFFVIAHFVYNIQMISFEAGEYLPITTAIRVTFTTSVLIFGILLCLLRQFPGWLSPFSNTLGLVSNDKIKNLLIGNPKHEAGQIIQTIYNNPSLLINEITQANVDNFIIRMRGIFTNVDQAKQEIEKMVNFKELVAYCIWYTLTGVLVIEMSTSSIKSLGN